MTRTVARLILAMLLLPCTGAVFLLLFVLLVVTGGPGPPAVGRLLLMWLLLYAFVAAYWVMLWRDMVTWNQRRLTLTALGSVLSLAGGSAVAVGCMAVNRLLPPPVAGLIGRGPPPPPPGSVLSLAGGSAVAVGCMAVNRLLPPPIAVLIGGGTVPITWVLST